MHKPRSHLPGVGNLSNTIRAAKRKHKVIGHFKVHLQKHNITPMDFQQLNHMNVQTNRVCYKEKVEIVSSPNGGRRCWSPHVLLSKFKKVIFLFSVKGYYFPQS